MTTSEAVVPDSHEISLGPATSETVGHSRTIACGLLLQTTNLTHSEWGWAWTWIDAADYTFGAPSRR